MNNQDKNILSIISLIFGLIFMFFLIIGLIWGCCALYKTYNIWASAKDGEAQLAQATYNRQIAVKEAEAKSAAAVELAKAEVIRAEGIAKANKIIGESLNQNEAYLSYLWIETLNNQNNKVIYVPTEANMPITEASRLLNKNDKSFN